MDSFQGRLVAVSLVYFSAILLTLAAALFVPLVLELGNDATPWDQKQQASTQFLSLHTRLWPAILVLFGLLTVHTVIVSHRVAGPLYRFRKAFQAIAGGDLSRHVTIRKNDYLTKEAREINDMTASLRSHVEKSASATEQALDALSRLRDSAEASGSAEVNRLAGHLEAHLARVQEELTFFRTASGKAGTTEEANVADAAVASPAGSSST